MAVSRAKSVRLLRQRCKAYRKLLMLETISDGGIISLIARHASPMPPKPLLVAIRGEHLSRTLKPYNERPKVCARTTAAAALRHTAFAPSASHAAASAAQPLPFAQSDILEEQHHARHGAFLHGPHDLHLIWLRLSRQVVLPVASCS